MVLDPIPASPPVPGPRRRGKGRKAPAPEALTPEMLREALGTVLQEQLLPLSLRFEEQISGMQTKVSTLEQRIPNTQAIVDQVTAVLGPELSRQINDKLAGMALSPIAEASNGQRAADEASKTTEIASEQRAPLANKITDFTSVVGALADVLIAKFEPLFLDYRKEKRLDRQEARADKMVDSNPFAVADAMRASNSPMLPWYAAAFAPLPQVVTEARVRETTDALLVGMRARAEATRILREEQLRQREFSSSPDSPSSPGSPTSTSTPSPTNPNAPKPGSVTMTSQPSQPRLTLREVMG